MRAPLFICLVFIAGCKQVNNCETTQVYRNSLDKPHRDFNKEYFDLFDSLFRKQIEFTRLYIKDSLEDDPHCFQYNFHVDANDSTCYDIIELYDKRLEIDEWNELTNSTITRLNHVQNLYFNARGTYFLSRWVADTEEEQKELKKLIEKTFSSQDHVMEAYFSQAELVELNKLTAFVIDQITSGCNEGLTECLDEYFLQYSNSGYDVDISGISKDDQTRLIESLDEEVFHQIWGFCDGLRSISKDSVIRTRSLCINTEGKFVKFLSDYTKEKESLRIYGESLRQAGDYSPGMNTFLLKRSEYFDWNSEPDVLLVSIHLLTLNHPEKRL